MTAQQACGIDIGGTGIKGAVVDLSDGSLATERVRIPTPQPATSDAVAETVAAVVKELGWTGPVGITMPSVIQHGIAKTAANIDHTWIEKDTVALFREALGGVPVTVLNDADAAGLAEDRYGAAREAKGTVVLLTFGTGIGSAVLRNGVLLPNTEFGHLIMDGTDVEKFAAASVKERLDLSWKRWTKDVSRVLTYIESLTWPDVFVVGGGVSKKHEKWIPLLTNRTPVVPAALLNTAGIVGAAMAAAEATA